MKKGLAYASPLRQTSEFAPFVAQRSPYTGWNTM